jgi:hypothetical protein
MAAVCLRDVRAALAEHTLADCQALRDAVLGAPSSVRYRARRGGRSGGDAERGGGCFERAVIGRYARAASSRAAPTSARASRSARRRCCCSGPLPVAVIRGRRRTG